MLPNLNELIKPISEKIENFNRLDCSLPISFTSEVKMINRDRVQFGNSSSCIINRNGQRIFLSNNWFYIAAILAPLYEPFYQYKRLLNEIVDKDVLKQSDSERIKLAINNRADLDNPDKEYLIKFALEPLWWNGGNSNTGGKSLDRNDALVSPILSIANLVNASQSYVATLWEYFGENPRYATLLNDAADGLYLTPDPNYLEGNGIQLQKIWFGAPGSGKSYKVKRLTETSNDEGFEGMTTEERQMAYQEYLDNKNAGKSSYRGGKTNLKALTHPKLMKYIAESSGYEINSLFEISREDAFNEITGALEKYEPYLKDSITKGSDCHWKTGLNSYGDFIKEQSKSSSKRKDIVFRTTFHPDYDYASFVGCYKPSMYDGKIEYSFTPQVFTKAYIAAWENTSKPVYLVIEEINRGNCAQIFGDIFQLLDRDKNTGISQYPIQVDKDLTEYIGTRLGAGHPGIAGDNLRLPANLHIYATMNTSDQSLFPMDSAFKRRWDWEYVPIDLKCPESQFTITIGDIVYKWPSFLEKVNERIHALSDSEDKQMGNFFIKHDVEVEEFKSKVMFYLWSEVCKEYEKSGSFFKNRRNSDAEFTFNSLFPTNDVTNSILQGFMEYLGVEIVSAPQPSEQTVADSKSNQEAE